MFTIKWILNEFFIMGEERVIAKSSVQSYMSDTKIKSSFDSTCPPSTSRGLARSSGDCDASDTISFCSGKCSCDSTALHSVIERPCSIVDSTTLLHKSKWKTFKKYISCRFRGERKQCQKNPEETKESLQESSVVTIVKDK